MLSFHLICFKIQSKWGVVICFKPQILNLWGQLLVGKLDVMPDVNIATRGT
jgi:hypothetical protein